jgi:hypothetical protein
MERNYKVCKSPVPPNKKFSDFISSIEIIDEKYFANLPFKDKGFKVQIDLKTFEDIKLRWEENEEAISLNFNGGQIIDENIIVDSTYSISIDDSDTSSL